MSERWRDDKAGYPLQSKAEQTVLFYVMSPPTDTEVPAVVSLVGAAA